VTEARERLITAVMLGVASGAILVPLNSSMLAVAWCHADDSASPPAE
jgi:hypothetical protein